ncbi:MAG TPA: toll/interleukin-1 receptor domain-containing protein [Verrucomicrobiae bacterium]|nr:toll/interleukin-1 receptor domain-containing protein [Verrucomicrobiae bacterium]
MTSGTNVFISYAADTRPRAEELAKALESQGIEPWVDFKDLHPGQRWRDELERALDSAQWLVILIGRDDRATPWQEVEWSAALERTWADREKRLLPVVFGEGDTPPFLRNWVSLRIDPKSEGSTWTYHVLDAMRNIGNESTPAPDPLIRAQRQSRLEEVRKAAEELRKEQPGLPPTAPPGAEDE